MKNEAIIKETLQSLKSGLLFFAGFWLAGWLGAPIIWLYIAASTLIIYVNVTRKKKPGELLLDFLWLSLIILAAVYLGYWLGGSGFLGVMIIVLIFSGIVLFRRRKLYMSWIYHIEEEFLYGERLRRKKKK